MGYSTYVAIALPAIGYDSLCTYALLGAPIVVFVDVANGFLGKGHEITLSQAGSVFFMFLPIVSTMIGFAMLWIVGKGKAIKEGWLPCLITGVVIGIVAYFTNRVDNLVTITGLLCGLAVIIAMALYLKLTGKKIIDKSKLTDEESVREEIFPPQGPVALAAADRCDPYIEPSEGDLRLPLQDNDPAHRRIVGGWQAHSHQGPVECLYLDLCQYPAFHDLYPPEGV
jgi:L-lactate permease